MSNSRWPFDRALIISLPKDYAKFISTQRHLREVGIAADRWIGTVGKQVALDDEWRKRAVAAGSKITPSELGCMLSHLKLMAYALRQGWESVAIFEDDALTHASSAYLESQIEQAFAQTQFDILYLGKCLDKCTRFEHQTGHLFRTYRPLCCHAYIITRSGMEKVLSSLPTIYPIDVFLSELIRKRKMVAITFHPSLFVQDVVRTESNLRSKVPALTNIVECGEIIPGMEDATWQYRDHSLEEIVLGPEREESGGKIEVWIALLILALLIPMAGRWNRRSE